MSAIFDVKKYCAIMLSIIVLTVMNMTGFAQPVHHGDAKRPGKTSVRVVKKAPVPRHKSFIDSRHHHNQTYLMPGHSVRTLPRNHRVVVHHNNHYYHSHGVWYRHLGGRYIVVSPPVGLFVPFLPFAYATIWVNGIPYYYSNETYYMQTPGGYVVVEPPQGEVSETPPATGDDEDVDMTDDAMFIYPRKGQTQAQQDRDRYECHQWAVEQTGYDPTQSSYDMPDDETMQQRADYRDAMASCLDSRGYAVK
jgi:hypothetical protein